MTTQAVKNRQCAPRPHPDADARFRGRLSGTVYYDFFKVRVHLRTGTGLTMHRERGHPGNSHAVAVKFGKFKLGYIPRSENRNIARLLDAGALLQIFVAALHDEPGAFGNGLEVTVRGVKCGG